MARLIWSPAALDDLESIAEFISRDSEDRARIVVTRIVTAAEHLAEFPDVGRAIPEIGHPSYREIVVQPYRIMYRTDGEGISITGIVHGARDWPNPPTD